jgi:nucleoside-diphosphate-sugar epimerase
MTDKGLIDMHRSVSNFIFRFEMVTINQLIEIVAEISGKSVKRKHKLDAPTGVRGRNSSNVLIRKVLGWDYQVALHQGLGKTYTWISDQVEPELTIGK